MTELDAIARLADVAAAHGQVEVLARVGGRPIHAITLGRAPPEAPALLVVGGVHGTEPLGAAVAAAYLEHLLARLRWDDALGDALARARVVLVPAVNPVGLAARSRCNGNGVDLMRNAPPHPDAIGTPLVGGHRLSPRLPWFMGAPGAAMEPEAAALCALVERELFPSRFAIVLDVHSGFGLVDRLWYPYARTRAAIPDADVVAALGGLLDDTLPHHVYRYEQTARVYTIQGDLWDHLYDLRRARGGGVMLPLTLEMGTWRWRERRRILRRHLPLLELLHRAAGAHRSWAPRPTRARRR